MNALTLQWQDAGQLKTHNIYEQQPSKNPGTVRIGRDPLRCDIVLTDPTVSGLHVEIFFHNQQHSFYIRNLRSQNPPLVDGQQLVQGEKPLHQSSIIYLGQMQLQVTAITIDSIPATILTPPQPSKPPGYQQPIVQMRHPYVPTPPTPQGVYGLECPKCHKVSPPENLQIGCPWCGTSLAAAVSVLVAPRL
ncbi:FHA domain-containing protein [Nostoc sp. FACHB-152]|uniref:FHA domain-containing protein n=1 Tax=unclassified Nostoc TaxID=2593658 RepID=UPI0016889AC1|nr:MULTISPECIES: FHA domain-containing protein [unclassified Nostoc]MBD2447838.1 FHA domain-containing protein [Nostoc sp. FACHB-152]MBD2468588.1 FHA domain-containing protein [Nostoc sp. FACHB-145]